MEAWQCRVCGYVYDPRVGDPTSGIGPGIPFEDLPLTWLCPICQAGQEYFDALKDGL
jgi:rubredoxin